MPRYILMPEDGNLEKVRKIELPEAMVYHPEKMSNSANKTRSKPLNNRRILGMVKNKEKARKLLLILRKNKVLMNDVGEVYYQDEVIPGTHLEELFCDLLNASRKLPPKNYEQFYKILNDLNIDMSIIPKNRVKYFN